jgi:hypothetical protein
MDGDEWSASRPGCFTMGERTPDTYSIWEWVGPRACLDAVAKYLSCLYREWNPGHSAHGLVNVPTELDSLFDWIYDKDSAPA